MAVVVVTLLVLITLLLLVTEAVPIDLTALGIIVALMLSGILAPEQALAGFAHPAPVTVGALFVVSAGLERTGALSLVAARLSAATAGRPRLLLLVTLGLSAPLSAFVNNTPVVVLMISMLMSASDHQPVGPSKFLMPLSFVSILAGTSTLIGTSTNIIVSDLGAQLGLERIGMFELTAIGLPLTVAGALFLFLFSFRLLPDHRTPLLATQTRDGRHYISELQLPQESRLVGCRLGACRQGAARCETCPAPEIYEVIRGMRVLDPAEQPLTLQAGDVLLAKAPAKELVRLLDQGTVTLPQGRTGTLAAPFDEGALIVELIVSPTSRLVGRAWQSTMLGREPHIHCIGVQRQWRHYPWHRLDQLHLAVGDILLVQCPESHLQQLRAGGDVIVVEELQQQLVNRRRAPVAALIFAAMVASATTGLADILVASLSAAVLMLATGCLGMRDAYRAVDARTLLLIVGTLALGQALEQSGAAQLYADAYLRAVDGAPPWVVLGGLIGLTSLLSHVLSNNSTAVLMTPVALSAARSLGVATRPFIIGLCFGASACFASPVGYQTNLLVYGPGGYRFADYLRLGLPLDLLVVVGATVGISLLWPLG